MDLTVLLVLKLYTEVAYNCAFSFITYFDALLAILV